jgi:hypothetical protein
VSEPTTASGWANKPANLDEYLQAKLNREVPLAEGSWGRRFRLEEYRGELRRPIWQAFGQLYDSIGDASGSLYVATTERQREIDFRLETFAAATGLEAGGRQQKDWVFMGSSQQKIQLESQETHAERKILASMKPRQSTADITEKDMDAMLAGKTTQNLRRRQRWLGAFLGGWTDTLFLLVTRSPCCACSEALVKAIGEHEQEHHFRHLVVAFCTYYKGGVGKDAMPCPEFCARVGMAEQSIELFKVHWDGTTDSFRQSRQQQHSAYWYLGTAAAKLRSNHPIGPNGLPFDPRYVIYRLLPR